MSGNVTEVIPCKITMRQQQGRRKVAAVRGSANALGRKPCRGRYTTAPVVRRVLLAGAPASWRGLLLMHTAADAVLPTLRLPSGLPPCVRPFSCHPPLMYDYVHGMSSKTDACSREDTFPSPENTAVVKGYALELPLSPRPQLPLAKLPKNSQVVVAVLPPTGGLGSPIQLHKLAATRVLVSASGNSEKQGETGHWQRVSLSPCFDRGFLARGITGTVGPEESKIYIRTHGCRREPGVPGAGQTARRRISSLLSGTLRVTRTTRGAAPPPAVRLRGRGLPPVSHCMLAL